MPVRNSWGLQTIWPVIINLKPIHDKGLVPSYTEASETRSHAWHEAWRWNPIILWSLFGNLTGVWVRWLMGWVATVLLVNQQLLEQREKPQPKAVSTTSRPSLSADPPGHLSCPVLFPLLCDFDSIPKISSSHLKTASILFYVLLKVIN